MYGEGERLQMGGGGEQIRRDEARGRSQSPADGSFWFQRVFLVRTPDVLELRRVLFENLVDGLCELSGIFLRFRADGLGGCAFEYKLFPVRVYHVEHERSFVDRLDRSS